MEIEHGRERLIIAKLILAITRAFARFYYPGKGLAPTVETQVVGMAVLVGHIERPMSASAIARYVGMPRTTVLRRLEELIRQGYVVRKGRAYCFRPEAVNGPLAAAVTRANIRRIKSAAKELSKMDKI